jgi:hypothetical protein
VALLAEDLVEEWLNRQGFFTIRGVKEGVDEMDLLATRLVAAMAPWKLGMPRFRWVSGH